MMSRIQLRQRAKSTLFTVRLISRAPSCEPIPEPTEGSGTSLLARVGAGAGAGVLSVTTAVLWRTGLSRAHSVIRKRRQSRARRGKRVSRVSPLRTPSIVAHGRRDAPDAVSLPFPLIALLLLFPAIPRNAPDASHMLTVLPLLL